jgi:arylsulfatase A-like enzyme
MARITALLAAAFLLGASAQETPARLNVLFIAVDDLKPALGCYGDPLAKTPHLDRLAARGMAFTRAYCQQAVCSPSRSSLLTGRRPDTTRVYDLVTHFRKALPDVVTLPQLFKNSGYVSVAMGKLYHGGYDDPPSWSRPLQNPRKPGVGPRGQEVLKKLKGDAQKAGEDASQVRGLPFEAPDVDDDQLADGDLALQAVEALGELKDKPFFLAVGFHKPHLPFIAPKKYWDLFKPSDFALPAVTAPPQGAPKHAPQFGGELRQYHEVPKKGPLPDELARSLIHGYYASTSFLDAQVGRVLAELDRLDLARRTVVVLWGDHGWHLGDHGMWCKHTNYEQATRSPLLVAAPGMKAPGKSSDALVEFVDIFPTLADLCGLAPPAGLEGLSFKPLLDEPAKPWKKAALSQYPRGKLMGYSLRSPRYRAVGWRPAGPPAPFDSFELYDLEKDPAETVNVADDAVHAAARKELEALLQAGWKAALP